MCNDFINSGNYHEILTDILIANFPEMAANFVKNYLEEYNNSQVRDNLINRVRLNHWTPPDNMYKVNFDGAYEKLSNKGGIGVIIRNSEGVVMGTHVGHKSGMMDAFMVEANGCNFCSEFC